MEQAQFLYPTSGLLVQCREQTVTDFYRTTRWGHIYVRNVCTVRVYISTYTVQVLYRYVPTVSTSKGKVSINSAE